MGLIYQRGPRGPNCFESPDVRVVDNQRDIPYTGTLTAVLVPVRESDEDGCQLVGMIFDEENTLIVDCLHSDEDVMAFRVTCRENGIGSVPETASMMGGPCPPPKNQLTLEDWRHRLFLDHCRR